MIEAAVTSLDTVILTRAAERILLILVGALAVFLGYRLFRLMPSMDRAEGKIELPGGVSIFLSRIGPGVFLALFGCAIIGYSVTRPVALTIPTALGQAIDFSGLAQPNVPRTAAEFSVAGIESEVAVARLNGFLAKAKENLSPPEVKELEEAVRAAKYSLMLSHWKPAWGDRAAFERWARENGDRDPPSDLAPGATIVYHTVL